LHDIFEEHFGRPPELATSAPGRVNIIGEHTDYNGGFMLPIALPHRTDVLLAARDDSLVQVRSLDVEDSSRLAHYRLGDERRSGGWLDYIQGVTYIASLMRSQMSGCDLLISSTVPIGKGLSSSAALQVSLFRALNQAWHLHLDNLSIARLAHRAETEFVGAPVGIMDQIAANLGNETSALLIDARSLAVESVSLPGDVELAVLDSGIRHNHASGDYKVRRRECEAAASRLGVAQLRDLDEGDLAQLERLPPSLSRRARHVITENARVLATVRAFRAVTPHELVISSPYRIRRCATTSMCRRPNSIYWWSSPPLSPTSSAPALPAADSVVQSSHSVSDRMRQPLQER
jgi:galactokinase